MKSICRIIFACALTCFAPFLAYGQTQVAPFLNSTIQLFDNNGNPCAGCLLSTFAAGTTTPLATYSESTGTTPNQNPVVLDSAGRATIYLTNASYKFVLKSALSATIWTQDQVTWNNLASTLSSLTLTGNATVNSSTAATNSANQTGPTFGFCGNYWTGAASASDCWNLSDVLGTGSNPTSTLTLTHSGSSGTPTLSVPALSASSASISGAVSVGLRERDCRQDGTIDTTGVADSSTAVQACINNAYANNQTAVLPGTPPSGGIIIGVAQNWTNKPGLKVRGNSATLTNGIGSDWGTRILCSTGTPVGNTSGVCIDTTGSSNMQLSGFQIISFSSPIALLMGRDNAGSPSGSGQFCFQDQYRIHDIGILMAPNLTANGGFGAIGIANMAAEDGIFENVWVVGDTPAYFSSLNPIPIVSPYQTLFTGCTNSQSMTQVTFINFMAQTQNTTKQAFYANNTGRFWFIGGRFAGGARAFRIENTAGASVTYDWFMRTTEEEVGPGPLFSVGVGLDNFDVQITDVPQGITSLFDPTANSLTFTNMRVNMNQAAVPFITNTATGTLWKGGQILIPAATSASNVTLSGTKVDAPAVADASIVFNSASNYTIQDSTGVTLVHQGGTTGATLQASGAQTFLLSCNGTASSSVTVFLQAPNSATQTCTDQGGASLPTVLVSSAGTIQNLACHAGTAGHAAGSGVMVIRKNGGNQALTCTIGTGTSCTDTNSAHNFTVAAGDLLAVTMAMQATETIANVICSFEKK